MDYEKAQRLKRALEHNSIDPDEAQMLHEVARAGDELNTAINNVDLGPSTLYDPANHDDLVHYWSFNGTAKDHVGDLNLQADTTIDGITIPPFSYMDGVSNQALTSLGVQPFENVDAQSLPTETVTVATWFEFSSMTGNPASFLVNDAVSGGENVIYLGTYTITQEANFICNFRTDNETSSNGFATIAIPNEQLNPTNVTDTPILLAFRYDNEAGEANMIAKMDGRTEQATYQSQNLTFGGPMNWDNGDFIIGDSASLSGASDHTYTDETMIFNSRLSDSRIDSLYQQGLNA